MRKNASVVRRIYRSFMMISILTALTATLGMFIDNVIVGHCLGSDALGALGAIGPISLVLSALGNVCSSGGATRAAQALGRGEREEMSRVFTCAVLFAVAAGTAVTVLGLAFVPHLAALLGAKGELHSPAVAYLYGFLPGAVPTIMTTVLMSFVKIDGSPRLPLACIGVMSAANVALDLLTIVVLDMGMFGAGLATSASYLLSALAGCFHFTRRHATLRLIRPRALLGELRAIALTGAPTAISRICDTLKVTLLNNLLIIAGGAAAVTALNVRTQTSNLLGALLMGVSQAIGPVGGMFYGEEDRDALKSTLLEALFNGLVLSLTAGALLGLFPAFFARMLGIESQQTLGMASAAIRLFGLAMPLQMLNMVAMSFYQSTRSTGAATMVCVLQQLALTTLFAFLLIRPMGTDGVWLAFVLAEAGTLLAVLAMVCRRRGFPRSLTDLMLLPEGFGGDPEAKLAIEIGNSMEEVMAAVEKTSAFAQNRGLDAALINRASLCIEEMAGNVVQHAFPPGRDLQMDLLVIDKPDSLLIRLRDHQAMFDPKAYLLANAVTPAHPGIRMIHGIADDLAYARTIGLNNLRIVLKKQLRPEEPS